MSRDIALRELSGFVGKELGISEWFTVSQEQINEFADATGDHQWMHVDIARATRERGGTIAHGLLILSLIPQLSDELMRVTEYSHGFSYGYDHVRFSNTVRAGARVRLRQTLTGVEPRKDGTLIRVACVIEIENDARPALVTENLSLYYSGAAAKSA